MVFLSQLTVEEFRELLQMTLHDLIEELVEERIGMISDPDEGMPLNAAMRASLTDYLNSDRRGDDADAFFDTLGIDTP